MKKRKKNETLKTLTAIAACASCTTSLMGPSDSWIPAVICAAGAIWILIFICANKSYFLEDKKKSADKRPN